MTWPKRWIFGYLFDSFRSVLLIVFPSFGFVGVPFGAKCAPSKCLTLGVHSSERKGSHGSHCDSSPNKSNLKFGDTDNTSAQPESLCSLFLLTDAVERYFCTFRGGSCFLFRTIPTIPYNLKILHGRLYSTQAIVNDELAFRQPFSTTTIPACKSCVNSRLRTPLQLCVCLFLFLP